MKKKEDLTQQKQKTRKDVRISGLNMEGNIESEDGASKSLEESMPTPFDEEFQNANLLSNISQDLDPISAELTKTILGFRPIDFVFDRIFLKAEVSNLTGYYPVMKLSKLNRETDYQRNFGSVSMLDPASYDLRYECKNYAVSGQTEQEMFYQERKEPNNYLKSLAKQFYFRLMLQKEIEANRILSSDSSYILNQAKEIRRKWTESTVKVVDEIEKAKNIVLERTSLLPNTIVISKDVYEKLSKKDELLEYVKYTGEGRVSLESLGRILGMKAILGNTYYKKASSSSTELAFKNMAAILYVAEDASLPTFGLGFQRRFYPQAYKYDSLEGGRISSYAVVDSYQQQVINKELGFLYKEVV